MLLDGTAAIISGVGPGLGRAIALAFAAEGAAITIGARSEESLSAVAAELESHGVEVLCVRTDITSADDCAQLAAASHERFGRIDVLVNNGHVSRPQQRFDEADLNEWRASMEVNYWGSLKMSQAVVPYMKARGEGRIIMVNSMAMAKVRPADGPYVGSKSALAAATRFLAIDLAPFGIRVNGVHPGYMRQDKLVEHFERTATERGITPDDVEAEIVHSLPLGYIPSSDEVAGTVVFLASSLSRPITGQAIHVNAGAVLP